jgi:hypothetical protein
MIGPKEEPGKITLPQNAVGRCGCILSTNSVTTPKFDPPPRTPQNNSAFSCSDAVMIDPSAVTMVTYIPSVWNPGRVRREVYLHEVIDNVSVLSHQVADTASESEPADIPTVSSMHCYRTVSTHPPTPVCNVLLSASSHVQNAQANVRC